MILSVLPNQDDLLAEALSIITKYQMQSVKCWISDTACLLFGLANL